MENHMIVSGNPLSTQKIYLRGVRDLMEGLESLPEDLTADQIKGHLSSLKGTISSSALNSRVCGIKYYFRHIVKRPDLVVGVPNPRVAKYVQEVMTRGDVALLFSSCQSMRELSMLHLLYDTGMRSREVCQLKLTDFEKATMTLTIRNSKGGKLRVLPYSADLRKTLTDYFNSLPAYPTDYLFENWTTAGQPITNRGVQYIVKEVLKRSKLKKEIHPHTFRHTFAVHYLDNGGNIKRLQELLGHEDMETTLHYLKFSNIPLRDTPSPLAVLMASLRKPNGQ